ncbi:TPA: hypothetical protein OUJ26_001352 [Acinetobacter baumannii]|nr:hypothetical protein [Acinetobacter baumannii]
MSYEKKTGYELKFFNEQDFEIICLDYNYTNRVRRELEEVEFVSNIASVDGSDVLHLQKILGKTNCKENLISLLDNWFAQQGTCEVKTYSDFD